jgi:MFS family permease
MQGDLGPAVGVGRAAGRAETGALAWWRRLPLEARRALVLSYLGWVFDGYETFALVLVANAALQQLLPAELRAGALGYQGIVIGITLLGWACGGVLWGILADYFGRKPTMIQAILIYSVFTGLTFFAQSWQMLAVLRFLTGLGLGAEWGTGVSLVVEKWPESTRAKAAACLQSGIAVGFFIASFAWFLLQNVGPDAWRYMFLVGVLPALLVLYLRRGVQESERWAAVAARRRAAAATEQLSDEDRQLREFTLKALFEPRLRRDTIVTLLMSLATNVGWWGVATWVPIFIGLQMRARFQASPDLWGSYAGFAFNALNVVGLIAFAFIADAVGRKPTLLLYFALSIVLVPLLFLGTWPPAMLLLIAGLNGAVIAGQYSWFAVYLPELYPTRVRATAAAFMFNSSRFVAFLGPIFAGAIISALGGLQYAATAVGLIFILGFAASFFARETLGQPLPE